MEKIFIGEDDTFKWEKDNTLYCLHIHSDDSPCDPRKDYDNLATLVCRHRRYRLGDDVGDVDTYMEKLVRKYLKDEDIMQAAKANIVAGIRIKEENGEDVLYADDACIQDLADTEEKAEFVLGYASIKEKMEMLKDHAIFVPLWLYDHSGITMSCGKRTYPYSDQFDSSSIGFAVAEKERIMAERMEYVLDENGERIKEEHTHANAPSTYSYKVRPVTEETWKKIAEEVINDEVALYDTYLRGEVYGYTLLSAEKPENGEEPEWEEVNFCWGFFGDDLLENGIADEVGFGLMEALKSGAYQAGVAKKVVKTTYQY